MRLLRSRIVNLPCKLTDDEVRTAGIQLASVVQTIAAEVESQKN